MPSRRARLQLLGVIPTHAALAGPGLRPVLERGAWRFISGLEIDADGAPRAYALPGGGKMGLDDIRNAGTPKRWYGLACDPQGRPYIQGPGDPAPGYCVSMTALSDPTCLPSDPHAYVDASQVPYVVAPPDLVSRGVRMGDLAAVQRGPKIAFAIVAYVLFPGSHASPPWRRSMLEFQATAARLYAAWRGVS